MVVWVVQWPPGGLQCAALLLIALASPPAVGFHPVQFAFRPCVFAIAELLVSPSDDGNVLIWHYASGRLVAVLPPVAPAASDGASGGGGPLASLAAAAAAGGGTTCVAPHPLLPMLASAGMDSSVRLWSPEAAQQSGGPEQAAAAVRSNLEQLAAGGWQQPASASELMGGLLGSRRAAPSAGTAADPCNTV